MGCGLYTTILIRFRSWVNYVLVFILSRQWILTWVGHSYTVYPEDEQYCLKTFGNSFMDSINFYLDFN